MSWTKNEESVAKKICSNRQDLSNTLGAILASAFNDLDERPFAQDIYVSLGVLREELGLQSGIKPGDVDFLIIPHDGKPMWDKVIAVELKVVRPTIKKPSKNASSMGVTQAKGLLRDGFPYVGLIHVVIPESSPEHDLVSVPVIPNELENNGEPKEGEKSIKVDFFPMASARRQEGRILATDLPDSISYQVIGFAISKDTGNIIGNTCGEQRFGKLNPNCSNLLISNIANFYERYPDRFTLVRWFD